jgi:hypothetical protein
MKPGTIAAALSTLGVLLILAGAFGLIRMNIALYSGIACFILSGAIPAIVRRNKE